MAIAEGGQYLPKIEDADQALAFITSESVATNLQLSIEMIEGLRQVANVKYGVRATLHSIFFIWLLSQDRVAILELSNQAHDEIMLLNESIRALEKSILDKN
jgi:hypothetical protein